MVNWHNSLDEITANFREHFGHLSREQLNWKPDPKTWSIAQNIDHLIKINESYYPTFDALLEDNYKAPFHAQIGFVVNLIGKAILNSVDPENRRKAKTFPIWKPSKSEIPADIMEQFAEHQEKLKSYISKLEKHRVLNTVISSPANRNIVYTLEQAIEIIATHEKRHFGQAQELEPLAREVTPA